MSNFELNLAFEACKYYDKIVGYNYNTDDKLTDFIIQKYKEFVFHLKIVRHYEFINYNNFT